MNVTASNDLARQAITVATNITDAEIRRQKIENMNT